MLTVQYGQKYVETVLSKAPENRMPRTPIVFGLAVANMINAGVDIGAIEFIHRKIVALRDEGCAVLLVSAELEEVTALSDRLLVIHNGAIVGEVDPKKTTNEEIGLMMTAGRA